MRLLAIAFSAAEASSFGGFAQALNAPFDVLLFGDAAGAPGAEKLFCLAGSEALPADAAAKAIVARAGGYTHLAAPSTMRAKDVLGRVAAILDASAITDVIGVESPTVFHRPYLAGAAIARVEALSSPVVLTFRPPNFAKVEMTGTPTDEAVAFDAASPVRVVSRSARGGARPDLAQAKIVVTGGRPLRDAETYEKVIGGLADRLGAATGATRAAVDSGIAPNESQVGQTGKIVAPELYIAAGVSGSTQHVAGMKDSKTIVAINKDPDAPIFEVADLGLVADLFDALPELASHLP